MIMKQLHVKIKNHVRKHFLAHLALLAVLIGGWFFITGSLFVPRETYASGVISCTLSPATQTINNGQGAALNYTINSSASTPTTITLTSGTTWHAAGLVGQMRPNRNMTRMSKYGIELYATLEQETGLATGWKQCGSLTVARTPERMTLLRRSAAISSSWATTSTEYVAPVRTARAAWASRCRRSRRSRSRADEAPPRRRRRGSCRRRRAEHAEPRSQS